MERWFLSQKGSVGGRWVKEKQQVSANDACKDNVVACAVEEPVLSSLGGHTVEKVIASGNNNGTQEDNVRQCSITISEDGFSAIATKLGTFLMLDSYRFDMCMQSWGKSSYARAIIKLRADVELKDTIVVAIPKLVGEKFYMCTIRVEILDKLQEVFQLVLRWVLNQLNKFLDLSLLRIMPELVEKKKDAESRKEVSNLNPFDELNLVENIVDLGTNGRTLKSAGEGDNSGRSSFDHGFFHVEYSSTSTTPTVERIYKLERQSIDGKLTLVDDD
nr:hypothetical protein [Tanacetum cinerariifolium]